MVGCHLGYGRVLSSFIPPHHSPDIFQGKQGFANIPLSITLENRAHSGKPVAFYIL